VASSCRSERRAVTATEREKRLKPRVHPLLTTLVLVVLSLGSAGVASAVSVSGSTLMTNPSYAYSTTGRPVFIGVRAGSAAGELPGIVRIVELGVAGLTAEVFDVCVVEITLSKYAIILSQVTSSTFPGLPVGSTLELIVMDNGPTNDMVRMESLGFTPVACADRLPLLQSFSYTFVTGNFTVDP
jgi:hypothetical protein